MDNENDQECEERKIDDERDMKKDDSVDDVERVIMIGMMRRG